MYRYIFCLVRTSGVNRVPTFRVKKYDRFDYRSVSLQNFSHLSVINPSDGFIFSISIQLIYQVKQYLFVNRTLFIIPCAKKIFVNWTF